MEIGTHLGKYKLSERLGRGGMAEVYKAFQSGVERYVALKVMHPHLADSEDFQARFQREAKAIGQLQHPHIVRVIDFDSDGDHAYMVMEFVQGGSLRDYLGEVGGPLPEAEALSLTKQLADALRYAHGRGMVHRDIKPANVMFTSKQRRNAVLTDFGIARILDDVQLTTSGTMLGTPAYMAPEIVKGEPADTRADLYSLAAMLYEMVTGRTPHTGDTPYAVMLKQANAPLPPPQEINANISDGVASFLIKALAKDPANRFQNAEEMIIKLQELDATGTSAPFPFPLSAQRKPASKKAASAERNSMLPFIGAIAGVALVAIFTVFLLTRGGGERVTDTAADTTPAAESAAAIVVIPTETTVPPTEEPEEPTAAPTPVPIETPAPTVMLTAEPVPTPTPEPTAEPEVAFDLDNTPPLFICDIVLTGDEADPASTLLLMLDRMRKPAADSQYVAWVQMNGEMLLLDILTPVNGRLSASLGVPTPLDGDVIDQIEGLMITEEVLGSTLEAPLGTVIYDQVIDEAHLATLRDIAFNLSRANTQTQIAIEHHTLLQQSLDAGDLDGARRHAEHVLNIFAVDLYGDMDGNGQTENPGDAIGIRTYVQRADDAYARLAIDSAAQSLPADRLSFALLDAIGAGDVSMGEASRIFAVDLTDEAQPVSAELAANLNALTTAIITGQSSSHTLVARSMADASATFDGTLAKDANGILLFITLPEATMPPEGFVDVVWGQIDGEFVNFGTVGATKQVAAPIADRTMVTAAEVRRTPIDELGATPSGEVLFSGTLPTSIQEMLLVWTLGDEPLLEDVMGQADLVEQHGNFMQESLNAGDLAGARQHAEHVVNIIEGTNGANFGDLDGNGLAENPGNDYGVLSYLDEFLQTMPVGESAEQVYLIEVLTRSFEHMFTSAETVVTQSLKILATDSPAEAEPFADAQFEAISDLVGFVDADGNGVYDELAAESGIGNIAVIIDQLVNFPLE